MAELLLAKGADVNAEHTGGCVGYTVAWLRPILGTRARAVRMVAAVGQRRRWDHAIFLKHLSLDSDNLIFVFQSNGINRFIYLSFVLSIWSLFASI